MNKSKIGEREGNIAKRQKSDNRMKKVIVSENDLSEFLSYCVSYGYEPICINKEYPFLCSHWKFIFRLKKKLEEIDFENLKNRCPSLNSYLF